jgi:hypothetical protein
MSGGNLTLFNGLLGDLSDGNLSFYDGVVIIRFEFKGYTVTLTLFKVGECDLIVKRFISVELAIKGVVEWHYSPDITAIEKELPDCATLLRKKLSSYGIRISRNI